MGRRLTAAVAALAALAAAAPALAQPVRYVVAGHVVVAAGQVVPDLPVALHSGDAIVATTTTDTNGRFVFPDVAPGRYRIDARAGTLGSWLEYVDVGPGLPADVTVPLYLFFFGDDLMVTGEPPGQPMFQTSALELDSRPLRLQSRALPQALAALPGWAEEDNGLLHVRGVDDGVLYVEDGIPVYDRVDVAFGIPPSLAGAGTVGVATGHTSAQFGLKSGAVVFVDSPPAPQHWQGDVQAGTGSNGLGSAVLSSGGPVRRGFDLFAATAAERSSRFLDPVHPGNLHNVGGVAAGSLRLRTALPNAGQITAAGRLGRSRYDVPHGADQEDVGQDQRQRIVQGAGSFAWQQPVGRNGLQAGVYVRRVAARLRPSAADTPLTATSDRRHGRQGVLASWSRMAGRHSLMVGGEAARLSLHEDFTFAVTNDNGDADDLSAAARAFTAARPFTFAGRTARTQWSTFAQDRASFGALSLDVGVRYDRTALLVAASQWSPRLAAALESLPLGFTLRASFNRFFQPPQAEHLLLASSEAARALSPFASQDEAGSGGAAIEPERTRAWELGVSHRLPASLELDVAGWHRRVENYADPNVFFGTTIVFPNSVAKGSARGLDLRLGMPARRGWSGSASYSLSKVEQEGPINGGLFLEGGLDELGPGVTFTPDHDQRHVASASLSWVQPVGVWSASAHARYASGTPLELGELDDDDAAALASRPGADLIDLDRARVKPRLVVDMTASRRLRRTSWGAVTMSASVLNVFDRRYAFNFGNPFSGTHFGAPRQFRLDARVTFD